jgi:hypothetical protein
MSTQTTIRMQLRRIGWLLLIWASSVLTLGVIACLFRGLMTLAGLTV